MAKLHEAASLAAARGSLLFHLDLATEMARVAYAARGMIPSGLATLVDELGYRVFAFDVPPSSRLLGEARFDTHGNVVILPATQSAPPDALRLAEARETIAAIRFGDGLTHTPLVIPSTDPTRPLEGYALAVGEDAEMMLLAGHWHVMLDHTGRRVTDRKALPASTGPAARDIRGLHGTLLIDPGAVPNAIHTYLSMKHGVPLGLETQASGLHWHVDGERTKITPRPA
ncbi:MAG: hypothetical protein JF628_15070 [Sphingomonas sp.]|nr:hypothetical protein [Sphingomonas sp.]